MDALSRIGTWLSDHEAMISAVVGITVLAGVLFAGLRSLVLRRGEVAQAKIPAARAEAPSATDSSPADLDPLTVPGFGGAPPSRSSHSTTSRAIPTKSTSPMGLQRT